MSIEREQPSTAFKSMPHITTYGGSYFSAQSEKDSFGSFEPRQAKLQEAFTNDQLIGVKGGQEGEEFSFTPVDTSTFEDRMPLDFDSSAVVRPFQCTSASTSPAEARVKALFILSTASTPLVDSCWYLPLGAAFSSAELMFSFSRNWH